MRSSTGILEVFSPSPAAFSQIDQKLLEGYAEECARVRHAAIELGQRKISQPSPPLRYPARDVSAEVHAARRSPTASFSQLSARRSPYEAWTLVLGSLAILATIAVSFLIGSRIGWLRFAISSIPRSPSPCPPTQNRKSPWKQEARRQNPTRQDRADKVNYGSARTIPHRRFLRRRTQLCTKREKSSFA